MSSKGKLAVAFVLAIGLGIAVWAGFIRSSGGKSGGPTAPSDAPITGVTLVAAQVEVRTGTVVMLRAQLEPDRAAGKAVVIWKAEGGLFSKEEGLTAHWRAPFRPGRFDVAVSVTDGTTIHGDQLSIEVRMPPVGSEDSLEARRKAAAEQREQRAALVAKRIAELLPLASKEEITSTYEANERYHALEELGGLYLESGQYEEAAAVFDRMMSMDIPGRVDYKKASEKRGIAAYFLGQDDLAIKAIEAGGEYANGISRYYLAQIEEERGDVAGAIGNYEWAARRHDYAEPIFRRAMLELLRGDAAKASQILADESVYHDRVDLMRRLQTDPELRALLDAWNRSGLTMQDEAGWTVPAPEGPH